MDYQGNSDKVKAANGEKQIVKVVTGDVIIKPEGIGKKFKNVFFGGDLKTSMRFVAADVMLPAFRDLLVDAIVNGAKGVIYGDSSFRRRTAENRPRTVYNNPVTRSYRDPSPRRGAYLPDQPHPYRGPERTSQQEIILSRKEDAEVVVETLIDLIDKYEHATLSDLKSLIGERASYVDERWGWTSLSRVDIRQTRDGYLIDLPPVEVI